MSEIKNEEKETIAERVNDFLIDPNHTDEDCELVFTLYGIILNTMQENAALDMENSLLEREIRIAENALLRLQTEKDKPKYLS